MQKILAFDIATKTGWAFGEMEPETGGSFNFIDFEQYRKQCKDLIELYKPDIIICAEATRHYTSIRKMNQLCGAMRTAADKCNIKLYQEERQGKKRKSTGFPIDSQMKKEVLGDGNASKIDICLRYKTDDEDMADAMMFVEYLSKKINHAN